MLHQKVTGDFPTAYVERMCREFAGFRARWDAKPDKVFLVRPWMAANPKFAHVTDEAQIDWKTAEAICGFRVDRRRAYFLHDGKVMVWLLGANEGTDNEGIPLIGLLEVPDFFDTEPQAITVATPTIYFTEDLKTKTRPV